MQVQQWQGGCSVLRLSLRGCGGTRSTMGAGLGNAAVKFFPMKS